MQPDVALDPELYKELYPFSEIVGKFKYINNA